MTPRRSIRFPRSLLAAVERTSRPLPAVVRQALRLADRLGGHLVTGHIDGSGTVSRFDAVGDNRRLVVEAPRAIARYIARKGSVAVDGVSLTVNAVDGDSFEVNLIPHTLGATTLQSLQPGAKVNLEVDMLARYVERLNETAAGKESGS
jgi:riboflavin synthase